MEESNKDVKPGEETPSDKSPENNNSQAGDGVIAREKMPDEIAKELLDQGKRILVDKNRFDDRNDKAKLYEIFAPIIDKVKDKPDLIEKLLDVDKKGSLEDRMNRMEEDRRDEKRKELTDAVKQALTRWPDFGKDYPEIKDQVDLLIKRGVHAGDALRRSYLALHPEEAQAEAERMAKENANALGQFSPVSGSRSVPPIQQKKTETTLNEREKIVVQDLLGKDFGGGFVPVKSEEDYARLLEKHKDYLRARGFFDLS